MSRGQRVRPVGLHFEGDLRAALIDAAAAAIAESGVDGFSLRDVARRLGVSHAAPAHHFRDKAALLTAVAAAGFERFLLALAEGLAPATADPVERLVALGRAYARFGEEQAGYFAVMFHPTLVDVSDAAYAAASDAAFTALVAMIAECQRDGWRPHEDSRTLAAAAWSFAHGVTVLRGQGSLARHHPATGLDGVAAIARALLAPDGPAAGPSQPVRRRARR